DFSNFISTVASHMPNVEQRVLTNAVEKSAAVEKLLSQQKAQVITSIDAGTEETFKLVRGRGGLKKICENLNIYSQAYASRVTIKYIFTDGNATIDEVKRFVALM